MSALKQFTGFKGKCAFAQVGNLKFAIIARTDRDLTLLWDAIMEDVPLDSRGIKSAILIESSTLPTPKGLSPKAQGCPPAVAPSAGGRATLGTRQSDPINPKGVAPTTIEV